MNKDNLKKEQNYNNQNNNYSVKEHDEQFIKCKPNKRLMDALEESEKIVNGEVKAKIYQNVDEMVEDILNED